MAESGYLNFDLEIEHAGQKYSVQVLSSPAGEARAEIEAPLLTQIDNAGHAPGGRRAVVRGHLPR